MLPTLRSRPRGAALGAAVVLGLLTPVGALLPPVAASAGPAGTTVAGSAASTAAVTTSVVRLQVLSGRPDLVSGGDALVQVTLPSGVAPGAARVSVEGRDVTRSFTPDGPGRLRGLVTGLRLGRNVVRAALPDGRGATLPLTNHPNGGPLLAGAQVQPWICDNAAGGNAPARNAKCDTTPTYDYQYKDAATGQFFTYDRANPPGDAAVARTTTDQGETVRYVVRVEHGTQDRGNYLIGALYDPDRPSGLTWNHKVLVPFAGGAGAHHGSGAPTPVLDDAALSRGYVVANNSLHVHAQNINKVVSAEALMMLKERIVEQYGGPIRYTIGNGCSGGAIQQHMIAGEYPGLLDGLQPSCSFQDSWTTHVEVEDCHLLLNYFNATSPQLWGNERQRAAVDGHKDSSDCVAWEALFAGIINPSKASNCALPADQVYEPAARPRKVRCSSQDYDKAIWGGRSPAQWSDVERRIDAGFAKRPLDNLGVQYGLKALNAGSITPEQFVDLNTRIGGLDIDFKYTPKRMVADPGSLRTAYRSGQVTDARQLATVPIIDLRGYNESSEIHTSYHSYRMRARLDKRNGTHANQLIWTFTPAVPVVPEPPAALAVKSFLLMDRWLSRIEADPSTAPLAKKVISNKPADATDGCFLGAERLSTSPTCGGATPAYGDALGVAGGPRTGTVLKCRLKPLDPRDYRVQLTSAQLTALRAAFPAGVCDWSRPGVDEQPALPWTTFATGPGGTPLGAPPASRSFGG